MFDRAIIIIIRIIIVIITIIIIIITISVDNIYLRNSTVFDVGDSKSEISMSSYQVLMKTESVHSGHEMPMIYMLAFVCKASSSLNV
jgi:uncharacterized protein YpmB